MPTSLFLRTSTNSLVALLVLFRRRKLLRKAMISIFVAQSFSVSLSKCRLLSFRRLRLWSKVRTHGFFWIKSSGSLETSPWGLSSPCPYSQISSSEFVQSIMLLPYFQIPCCRQQRIFYWQHDFFGKSFAYNAAVSTTSSISFPTCA